MGESVAQGVGGLEEGVRVSVGDGGGVRGEVEAAEVARVGRVGAVLDGAVEGGGEARGPVVAEQERVEGGVDGAAGLGLGGCV